MQDDLAFIYPADISSNSSLTQRHRSTDLPIESSRAMSMILARLNDANAATDVLAKRFPTNRAGIRLFATLPFSDPVFPCFLCSYKMQCWPLLSSSSSFSSTLSSLTSSETAVKSTPSASSTSLTNYPSPTRSMTTHPCWFKHFS